MQSIGFHLFEVGKVYFIIDISFEMRMKARYKSFIIIIIIIIIEEK